MSKMKTFGENALSFFNDHKAQILIAAGIIGNTAATIIACKKTIKAKDILKDHEERRLEVENAKEICRREIKIYDVQHGNDEGGKVYTEQTPCSDADYNKYCMYLEKDCKKDVTKVYAKTGIKLFKHYAIPAVLYMASNAAILFGTGILTKQVSGLTTSLAAVTTAYSQYRERVKKVVGEETERRIFTNEQVEVKKYKDVDDDGNEIEKEETVIKTDGKYDPYSLLLDRNCYQYHNDIQKTLTELKAIETELNRTLMGRGMVTLNEVYEALGYAKTSAGAVVGWRYSKDPNEQEKYGDGYISFGIFDHIDNYGNVCQEPASLTNQWVDILNSHTSNRQSDTDEYDIWLHFNVDGPIIDSMEKRPGKPL